MRPEGPYVLAVDDEEGLRILHRRALERMGYEVQTADSAEEAMEVVRQRAPAVALIDVHMPGHGGLWLCEQIRAASHDTAMILATSDEDVPPTTSLRRGIVSYVIKPIAPGVLSKAVAAGFRWWAGEGRHQIPPAVSAAMASAADGAEVAPEGASVTGGDDRPEVYHGRAKLVLLAGAVALLMLAAACWFQVRGDQAIRTDPVAAVRHDSGQLIS